MKKILSTVIRVAAALIMIGLVFSAYSTCVIWWPKFLSIFSPEVSGSLQGFGVVVDISLLIMRIKS